ncbi:PAS domain S-box protein [Microscilla marina]|uniref:histidine kinase n=1 Tax=Microscilla marina ATCC 23134 TaxID=313606 RepID=A1ZE98_MICM2|nr:PAS domain S-box protein [Microscilla marina]EAY31406.1 multi-sensor Signal Transduction Histidine Kinase [Microscilla marina ATCC 23134]
MKSSLQEGENDGRLIYRLLADNSNDLISRHTITGECSYVSPRCFHLLGYRPEEMVGKMPCDLVHPDDLPSLKTKFDIAHQNEGYTTFVYRIRRKDHEFIWFKTLNKVIRDAKNHEIKEILCVSKDISKNKKYETDIIESEARFRRAFEFAPIGMALVDIHGRLIRVNRSLCKMLNANEDELIEEMLYNFVHPKEGHLSFAAIQQHIEQSEQEHYQTELRLLTQKQGVVSAILSMSLVKNRENAPLHYICHLQNITKRKQTEEALLNSERLYRAIVQTETELVCRFTTDGQLTFVNDAYCHYFKKTCDELVGTTLLPPIPEEDRNKIEKAIKSITPENEIVNLDFRIVLNQEIHWHNWSFCGIFDQNSGQLMSYQAVGRDITRNKRNEQQLIKKTQELETANKEMESFSYSVSHDLRAPLRSIDGFSKILAEDYAEVLDEEGKRLLGIISDNSKQMAELIDDLLAFSRVSRKEVKKNTFDMSELVKEIIHDFTRLGEHTESQITVYPLNHIKSDMAMLKQLWINLISNALKFSKNSCPPMIEIGQKYINGTCAYYIKDNGVGFDMRYAHKVFGVFQRLHRKEEFAGTGVGLAIVHRIVTKNKGKIWVESVPNKGTQFYFTLPPESIVKQV